MATTPRDCIPRDWTRVLGNGPLGLGLDLATTEKETSNPSSVTLMEKAGPLYVQRLVVRWKTSREEVTRAVLAVIFADLQLAKHRAMRLCVDATNERFFAQALAKHFSKFCPVQLVIASEKIEVGGEAYDYKTYTGNLYVNTFADALMRLPDARWLKEDHRLVSKAAGRFVATVDPSGAHADTFSSGCLARLALEGRGRAEASGAAVGAGAAKSAFPNGLKNPLGRLAAAARRLVTRA
jgi:hypothetical protein